MSEETKKNGEDIAADESVTEATQEASQSPLESEIATLKKQLEAKELEAKHNYDRLLRQMAELDNFKKRTARERAHASGGGNGKPLVEGVEMVLRGLLDVLMKHGVVQVPAVGQPFDPSKHEAMAQVESVDHEPNSVVEEFHKGYTFRDRLLRPALVSVAKAPGTKEKKNGESTVENGPSDD